MTLVTLFVVIVWLFTGASRMHGAEDSMALLSGNERRKHLVQTTLVGTSMITLWGVLEWDYFSRSPHAQSEGWFGSETDSGGADKLGHAYTTYVFSHALSALYQHWGFNQQNAALYGAFSSFATLSYMEFGDSFSNFGFSTEDLLANGVGALLGYVLAGNDDLAEKIDFRVEYDFSFDKMDVFTDYENSKYLLALKLNGFESVRNTPWRHLEVHLGYYTRNFDNHTKNKERNIYLGIGLNLTDLFQRHSWKKTATVLRYFQLPYTSLSFRHDLE
ncbi:MAG: DUF2279 domain-containing protein [Desulfopila sp.]